MLFPGLFTALGSEAYEKIGMEIMPGLRGEQGL
jgi:hypothetical protein